MTRARRVLAAVGTVLAGVLALVLVLSSSEAQTGRSMSALGDSFTIAFRACPQAPNAECPAASWATGSDPVVNSNLLRRQAAAPGLAGVSFAGGGRKVSDLDRQAKLAVDAGSEYVTILIGTNDVCRETLAAMTPVARFRSQFDVALDRLSSGLPAARVFVASIPDPERLREIFAGNPVARAAWAADGPHGTCGAFLERPLSVLAADVQRRAAAHARVVDLNRQLAEVCAEHAGCVYDGGAVFDWDYGPQHITTTDYFHFNVAGEAGLAAITYPLAFPAPGAAQLTPPAAAGANPADRRLAAKLKLTSARIRDGRLRVHVGITGRATGRIKLAYRAGGRRHAFSTDLGRASSVYKFLHLRHRLTLSERRIPPVTVTVDYAGGARVSSASARASVARRGQGVKR
jgi:lysophospholipase L1-like esterase